MSNNINWVTAPQAVEILNEILEHLESLCDACGSFEELNGAIDCLLQEHDVFAGKTYHLT